MFHLSQKYSPPTREKHFSAPAVIILCCLSEDFLFLETRLDTLHHSEPGLVFSPLCVCFLCRLKDGLCFMLYGIGGNR